MPKIVRRRISKPKNFEEYVFQTLKRRFPLSKGYRVEYHPHEKRRKRPDFLIRKESRLMCLIDAKYVRVLRQSHLDQLRKYMLTFKPEKAEIYISKRTEVPEEVKR